MTAELETPPLRSHSGTARGARRRPHFNDTNSREEIDSFVQTCTTRILTKLRHTDPRADSASHAADSLQSRAR